MKLQISEALSLRDGEMAALRVCTPADAPLFPEFTQKVAQETPYTRFSMGGAPEIEETASDWKSGLSRPDRLHLGVFRPKELVGYLKFRQPHPDHRAFQHVGDFGLMILQEYLAAMESYALGLRVSRIEARVRAGNDRALRLFTAQGYEIEGLRRRAACVDRVFQDEHHIGKLIGAAD